MTRRPPSKLDRLYKSHLKLLRLVRGQIQELGELRKVILEMRAPKESTSKWKWADEDTAKFNNWIKNRPLLERNVAPREFDVPPNDWPRL